MKRLVLCSILLTMLMASADDFEDYTVELARLARGYQTASGLEGSVQEKEFRQGFQHLQGLSFKLQSTVRRLNLGNDFNFPGLSSELYKIYSAKLERERRKRVKTIGVSEDPNPIFNTLLNDIKALRKMNFTTEDGGSIDPLKATKRRFMEFRRCMDFFNAMQYYDLNEEAYVSFKTFFSQRTARMQELAGILNRKIPKGQQKYHLTEETTRMLQKYHEWKSQKLKLQNEKRKKAAKKNFTKRNPGKDKNYQRKKNDDSAEKELRVLRSDMNVSCQRIMEVLVLMEQSGIATDPPLSGEDSKTSELINQEKDDHSLSGKYDQLSRSELEKKLKLRRNEVYRSNPALNGFDGKTRRRYMTLLTPEQRKLYTTFLKEYSSGGYCSGD